MSPKQALLIGAPFLAFAAIGSSHLQARAFRDLTPGPQGPSVEAQERQEPQVVTPQWFGPGPLHKVWIQREEQERGALRDLTESGAVVRSYDYGSFTLAIVDERLAGGAELLRQRNLRIRDEQDLMVFNEIVLNGNRPQETLAALDPSERFTPPDATALDPLAGLYIVQFEGPVRDEWLAELDGIGIDFKQFVPMNAYVVRVPDAKVGVLDALAQTAPHIQYAGAYEPAFRMHASLRQLVKTGEANVPQQITIQLVNRDGARAALNEIESVADEVLSVRNVGPYVNVEARVHPVYLQSLAANKAVFQLEPLGQREKLDERQDQIMAGNTSATGPSTPGYLAWITAQGFGAGQFGSFSVNVVDSAMSLTGHPDVPSSRVAFALNPTSQSGAEDGHGFLNAHIVAGFNDSTGSAFEDAGGYQYGLGIAPWAQVGSTAIFGPGGLNPTSFESQAYGLGARISTNSWGFVDIFQNPLADYNASAQEYDFITRDAQSGTGGNQEYLVVFSAGNGGGVNTVGSPGTAKNVLTVGASENDRQTGTDGCGVPNSGANNYNDLASFSSRGPVNSGGGDARWKPEIVAPGTHIQAGVPQSNYGGGGVCNQFWPLGQTLYGWSSGTSHSTPALAGAAALVRQNFLNQSLPVPSPALNKAILVNSGEYMTGSLTNDTLPSNAQGMGNVHLGRVFDAVPRVFVDQTELFSATGQSYSAGGNVADGGEPFRVTLVWTDAPGPTSGAPYVNDLDLSVTVGGTTYLGNVFSGANSTTGGSADFRNNTESVFLPAGTTGAFTVTVDASSIGGDGVPGNGDATDQDFALVIYNGTSGPVGPTANFVGSPLSGVVPLTVNFTDTSTAGVTSWSWDFGDGATSTLQNPSHTYNATGTYTVTLTVIDAVGSDSEVKTGYISVIDPPTPGISDGSFELQTAGTAPTTPWSDDFGTANIINPAGGTSADGGLPTDGVNWVEVSGAGTNGSSPPSNPGGFGSPPSGGAGVSQSFFYGSGQTLLSFDAAFARNEGANQGTYNDWMSVDITDGSSWYNLYYADTFTATPQTSSKYGYAMTAVTNVSVDLATIFPTSTTATNFTLTVQTGNAVDGVQASIGYADDFALTGAGPPAPVASFSGSPTSGTAPLNVSFTDSSTGSITSWSWSFGDGGTSTLQNPSYTYNAAGTYSVALTVTGPGGSDTLTLTNYITVNEPAPTANFTGSPTSGTAPLNVGFTDSSTGAITSWSWTFGDGATSTLQNPSHTYSAAGTYTVALTVTGPGGSDTLTRTDYITVSDAPPVADFNGAPTSGPTPLNVSFSDASTGSVTSWSWTFGDGATSTLQNPSHTYNAVGTYTVALTVTGPGGSDTLNRTDYITVTEPAPTADFTGSPTSGTAPLNVGFTDSSTGAITSWSWTFGDGATSTLQNPSHTYNVAGAYTVALTVTGPGGSDTLTRTNYITVNDPPPTAGFSGSPTSGIAPLTVNFTDASSGAITSWSWTFGDGATSTLQNPSHTYIGPGVFTVSLTVTGPGGSDTLTLTNYISVGDPPPAADFTGSPTSGVVPLAVTFTDASTGNVTSWSWDFGDGATSTLQNPSHTYNAVGTYTVALTVTGPGGGNTLTRTDYIDVQDPVPVANFTGSPTTGTVPLSVSFSDSSTGSITSWSWTFGDGGTSTLQNPSHTYNAAGTYTVALTVTGPGGSDTLTRTSYITVNDAAPTANFTGSPTSGTVPLNVSFTDASTGSITSWSWTFGDGGTSTLQNPSHTYNQAGTYTVALTVTGPGGSDTLTRTSYITVNDPPPAASFTATPTSGTAPLTVNFTDTSSGVINTWSWTFGDGATSTAQNPSHTYNAAGTYTVSLTVTGPGGSSTDTQTNLVTVTDPGGGDPVYYLSFYNNAFIPGVGTVADDDIVSYDTGTGTWALYFDGSDVGISAADVQGFHVRANGSILMTFNASSTTVPGLTGGPSGTSVDDSDVVLFTPTTTGPSTTGSFSFYFDGSDVGMTTNSEDIDGLYEFADGSLGISTRGGGNAGGLGWSDEDVVRFTGSFGSSTSGSFAMHWDGSDVGFGGSSSDDLDAVSFDADADLLFSSLGTWNGAGSTGADEDVGRFTGSFGPSTSGTSSLVLDLSALGISTTEDLDGLSYQP